VNLEPGAYTVCGFVTDAVEVRQRELKFVCSFIARREQKRGVLTRVSWFSGNSTPSTYTIATSEAEGEEDFGFT